MLVKTNSGLHCTFTMYTDMLCIPSLRVHIDLLKRMQSTESITTNEFIMAPYHGEKCRPAMHA